MSKGKKRFSKAQVDELMIDSYHYIMNDVDADTAYFVRQIEQFGSIKPDGYSTHDNSISDNLPDSFDFSWNE